MTIRLNALAKMVDFHAVLADIGTDHAYLPIQLVQSGKISRAIASDIAKGPLKNASEDIESADLTSQIVLRLGPGLSTITPQDQVDTVVIAGMGGRLICDILEAARLKKTKFKTLILQPNIGEPLVRQWLSHHHYQICAESIVTESGHCYELIKARLVSKRQPLTTAQCLFGPYLLQQRNSVFLEKWQRQLPYETQLQASLNCAKHPDQDHLKHVLEKIELIKGVLKNDKG